MVLDGLVSPHLDAHWTASRASVDYLDDSVPSACDSHSQLASGDKSALQVEEGFEPKLVVRKAGIVQEKRQSPRSRRLGAGLASKGQVVAVAVPVM